MWITSPPHRSVIYSPGCLFFLFSFWWGGGSLSHVASASNLIFVFFFSETQSSKPTAATTASQKGSCENQDSKTRENTTNSCSHTTETLHAPACEIPPPCSINWEKRKFCFICLHFFCVCWGWYTKPKKLMQNSSYKDGEEANSECAQLRKALFFPQEKKTLKKEK